MRTYKTVSHPIVVYICCLVAFAALCAWPVTPAGAEEPKASSAPAGGKLFDGKSLAGWKLRNEEHRESWKVVSEVKLDPNEPKKLVGSGTGGAEGVLFRAPVEHGSDIYTEKAFGDCELHVEVMVPKGSNSGIYLMGQYEVQVFDSFGKANDKVEHSDMGGIYSVKAPATNASKAPGEWQTFDIVFKAPRFDASGKKTANAEFVRVLLNGKQVLEHVEVTKPTGGEMPGGEKATGPLMFQGDHGVVAYRNITIEG